MTNGQLKDFQLEGLNWMISLYELKINGILADEMGLGKTVQTISFMSFLKDYKNINGKFLIICPLSIMKNWEREIKLLYFNLIIILLKKYNNFSKWLEKKIRVTVLPGVMEERENIMQNIVKPKKFDVLITTYQSVQYCLDDLKKISWEFLAIDEGHRIKNEEA